MNGGKLEKFYPIYEMLDTFVFTPSDASPGICSIPTVIDMPPAVPPEYSIKSEGNSTFSECAAV